MGIVCYGFIDITHYLNSYGCSPRQLALKVMDDITTSIGVRATCGIGTNLYLTKIALDITAKHVEDFIGELDEESYRRQLWNHRPLTDFWRIGAGTARPLEKIGIYTIFDVVNEECKGRIRQEVIEKDRKIQEAELEIKRKFGKNAILKGTSLKRESTAKERNGQIGGHKSGE